MTTSDTLAALGGGTAVLDARSADVGREREVRRRRRLARVAAVLAVPAAYLWWRLLTGDPVDWGLPQVDWLVVTPILFFVALFAVLVGGQLVAGRSPHVTYRPEQIPTRLADVKGLGPVTEEVVRSLNLFLAARTYRDAMGGRPRRGLLFEGAPGTGKTHLAKAMAREAGVPFLFVSATSFQSMFYGATARKIRAYFKALRKAARREGGAIGFIEEIDAIALSRGGVSAMTPVVGGRAVSGCHGTAALPAVYATPSLVLNGSGMVSEGTGGVVNELLVQLQSFDEPTGWERLRGRLTDAANLLLPAHRQLPGPRTEPTNLLLIAATNRADGLDPALLRPGRFDRRLTFEAPAKAGRRELLDHFLTSRAHDAELDGDDLRDALAGTTQGWTPVMLENLLDEALVNAVRRGSTAMSWADVERARLTTEVGVGQPVGYTPAEKELIATHEAGHATAAWLACPERRLEVLTIVKRRSALGLLAHGDREDVFTRSRRELRALVTVALAGQAAEEVFFGDVTTGPGGDLLYATNACAEMVGAHGMARSLVSYAAVQEGALGATNLVGRVLADPTGRQDVEELLHELKARAVELVTTHRHLVEALRDALLEREELIGHEITDVLEAAAARARTVDLRAPSDVAR